MFIATQGAAASTSAASISSTTPAPSPQPVTSPGPAIPLPPAPNSQRQHVRHLLLGTLGTVQATIRHLHKLGYAEPNDWSQPISTDRPNEVMAILTKRVVVEIRES